MKGGIKMIDEGKKTQTYKYIRQTHCFNCKKDINSQQYDECVDCKGIVCSCGSCFCEWGYSEFNY